MLKRALISVSDKTGLVQFAAALQRLGVELVSTGGTYRLLKDSGLRVLAIDEVTGFPEMLDGRVKTLHPRVHAGLLARRDVPQHMDTLVEHLITPIDLLVCNLYPFAETVAREGVTLQSAIENIDIGGPSMLRSAAKNHQAVTVVVNKSHYDQVISYLEADGQIPLAFRQRLALEAFRHTARYDAMIAEYLGQQYAADELLPETLTLTFDRVQSLRYGENPHQQAAFYREVQVAPPSLAQATQLQGKALSFCNLNDADAALSMVRQFTQPAAVAVKHANPCGVAVGETLVEAYRRAHDADPVSIFGGIVALNRPVDADTALELKKLFLDIVIAPEFSAQAVQVLAVKKNLRLLAVGPLDPATTAGLDYKRVTGGLLVQGPDLIAPEDEGWQVVTTAAPSEEQRVDLRFAWRVVKFAKSNAIVVAKHSATCGIGMGQVNRIDAAISAIERAGEAVAGAVLASDGLLPFSDVVEAAAKAGIRAIVQPGGSIRDAESIEVANRHGIAMVCTGYRHFRH